LSGSCRYRYTLRSAVVPTVTPGRDVGGDPLRNGFGVTEITRLFTRDRDHAAGLRRTVGLDAMPENRRECFHRRLSRSEECCAARP